MNTDQALIKLARSFDQQALASIYDQFSPGIYRYAVRLLGDPARAEACVSETFSRFLRALHKGGGPEEHLKAYLYTVAHNWINDYYRRSAPPSLPLDAVPLVDPSGNPFQVAVENQERERVRSALQLLTPDQRQVIVLKYLEGWSNAEVAAALDKPVGAVKSLQHRALAALRRILIVDEEESDV